MSAVTIRPETEGDAVGVDALVAQSFGPGRHAKSAYRLREGVEPVRALSLVLVLDGVVAGTVRYWPVGIGGVAALMLGPIAVRPDLQGQGYALQLMQASLALARTLGHRIVVLVGDEAYYGRAGFARIQPFGRITLPGPVDRSRVLGLELVPGALEGVSGEIRKLGVSAKVYAAGAGLTTLAPPAGQKAAHDHQ
ncbi:MAG: GNAT family N-acetyltransferase [Alphaproteobacteria bacterium]|jgi:predicted N-acetyltransferase YhbS